MALVLFIGCSSSKDESSKAAPVRIVAKGIGSGSLDASSIRNSTVIPGQIGLTSEILVNREIDISEGVNEGVSIDSTIAPATYVTAAMSFAPRFKIKAYAHFDLNNDGDVTDAEDATVYTTAAGIKKVANRVDPNTDPDYAEYNYGFLYTYCSSSTTNSSDDGNCGTITILPEPVVITETSSPTVTIVISSLKNVFAWTGLGNADGYGYSLKSPLDIAKIGDGTTMPSPVMFPGSNICTDTNNPWGLNSCNFFPVGTPAFALSYLPAFAFLDTTGLEAQSYLVSTKANVFNHFNSKAMTLVIKNGVPQLGMITGQIIGRLHC